MNNTTSPKSRRIVSATYKLLHPSCRSEISLLYHGGGPFAEVLVECQERWKAYEFSVGDWPWSDRRTFNDMVPKPEFNNFQFHGCSIPISIYLSSYDDDLIMVYLADYRRRRKKKIQLPSFVFVFSSFEKLIQWIKSSNNLHHNLLTRVPPLKSHAKLKTMMSYSVVWAVRHCQTAQISYRVHLNK
ncbi:hypothetical protein YC2023_033535 [Brassica napus]